MKRQSIAAVILGLLGSGCSTLVSKVFPLDDLPVPSGPHAVGTQYFEWVDGARAGAVHRGPRVTNAAWPARFGIRQKRKR